MLSILLVLDGSSHGQSSIELSIGWARRFGASVRALGIVDEYAITAPEPVPIGGDAFKARREERMLALANNQVDAALAAFRSRAESACIRFQTSKRTADRHQEIVTAAQSHDVVIMPRDTFFAAPDDSTPDGTLEAVVAPCPRPMVAVPSRVEPGRGSLIAYSGGRMSAQALKDFVANDLHQLGPNWILSVDHHSLEAAEQHARLGAEFLEAHGVQPRLLPVVSSQAVDEIVIDRIVALKPELVVMGSHSRSWLMSYLAGSTAREVLSRSTCPVFLSE